MVSVFGRRKQDLRGKQRPRQECAQHGNDEAGADKNRSPAAYNRFQHACHRRIAQARQIRPPHNGVGKHRHEHKYAEDAEKAQDRGNTDVAASLGVARINAGAFNSQEYEHGHQHRAANLAEEPAEIVSDAAPKVLTENVRLEVERQE